MTESEYEPSPWEFVADHVERYLASDGADGYEMEGAPCVILTTTGRRTGKVRRTPLIRVHDGDNHLVVASLGGAPQRSEEQTSELQARTKAVWRLLLEQKNITKSA